MNRERLLLWIASVLAGTTALLIALGAVYNLLLIILAIPFGAAAYFLWLDATGRLAERVRLRTPRSTAKPRGPAAPQDTRRTHTGSTDRVGQPSVPGPTRPQARRILGVEADADASAIRRAYRERAKEVHPDAEDGSEEAFKHVTDAYERLIE